MLQKVDCTVSIFIAGVSAIFAFLGLNLIQFIILTALMLLDFLSGIAKAYRIDTIRAHSIRIGITGKLLYLLVPLVIALALKGMNITEFGSWIISFSVNALILAEAYSILGNIYTFKTKKSVEQIDAVSYILRAIKNQLDKFLEGGGK
jgi:phage-related holin